MATQAEVLRQNRVRETERQIAASNYGQPEVQELANGIPSGSNDAALAAHLEEWRAKDVSYQRATNQEARDQIEAAYVASQNRLNAAKQEIKDRASLEKYQQNQIDNSAGERLALQMEELVSTFPMDWRPETLPMDKLRQLTDLRHRVQTLAAATGQPGLADGVLESGGPLAPANVLQQMQLQPQPRQKVTAQDAAKWINNNGDGTYTVKLETGEIFKGAPEEVMAAQAAAQVNTKLWARGIRDQAQAQQPTIQTQTQPIEQQIVSPQPTAQPATGSLADWWAAEQADALARQFKFQNKDEMMQWGEQVNSKMATISQYEDDRLAMDFTARCPDFPGTSEASEALANIVQSQGWDWNVESLQAAHLLATNNHVYQPLTAEQIQIANGAAPQMTRQTPPPLLPTGNPEISFAQQSPYEMSLGDLRKAALRQELEKGGPGYR